jgi:hypothetical protein
MQLLSVERLFEDDIRRREAEEIRIVILEAKVSAHAALPALRTALIRSYLRQCEPVRNWWAGLPAVISQQMQAKPLLRC